MKRNHAAAAAAAVAPCSSTMQQHHAAAPCSSTIQQCHAAAPCNSTLQQDNTAAPCSSRALILLLHLYLLAFFKFFSKLNIIFFSTIQYLSLQHYNTRCNTIHNNRFRCVPKWLIPLSRKHNRPEHVCNRIVVVPSAAQVLWHSEFPLNVLISQYIPFYTTDSFQNCNSLNNWKHRLNNNISYNKLSPRIGYIVIFKRLAVIPNVRLLVRPILRTV